MHKTLYLKRSVKQTVHYSSPCALGKHSKCSFTPGNASPRLVWRHLYAEYRGVCADARSAARFPRGERRGGAACRGSFISGSAGGGLNANEWVTRARHQLGTRR